LTGNPVSFDRNAIERLASELGFSVCGFTRSALPQEIGGQLKEFLAAGCHGTMEWMAQTLERRTSPENMWPDARTAIVLGMNYGPQGNPLATLEQKTAATISVYARNRDYHDLIKGRLKQIAQKIASRNNCQVKVFVDTAPLMEKPLAQMAGIGWQGKHTNLVSREFGSWLFLGTILVDMEFDADRAETDHCGSCRACLDICPTNAFVEPYKLDARKCISYLTIEHAGPIPRQYRKAMGNRIYGCDDCLAVCPWNKYASRTSEMKLAAREDLNAPELEGLFDLDDSEFRKLFSGSPIKRIGRARFIRNVLIASGNSGDSKLASKARRFLTDSDPLLRGASVWALAQLMDPQAFLLLHNTHIEDEPDTSVREEWQNAMQEPAVGNAK
jgi:epoxyqueuosine reductase